MSIFRSFAVIAIAALFAPTALTAAEPHSHDAHGAAALHLNEGRKWPTDAALRAGMDGIRAELGRNLGAIHRNTLASKEYVRLAKALESKVEGIVQNCKLPADADAQLHLVLAPIIDGVDAMAKGQRQREGAVMILGALDAYGRHFDHPNWAGLAH